MFTRGSRYQAVEESEYVQADGRTLRYKRIRFLPSPEGRGGYVVASGDRPDTAAWNIAQDAESYWRLCDANGTARPSELTARVGTRIIIPDPTGGAGS
jgi:hypothetical protein